MQLPVLQLEYIHKADETYLGILRINSATTTSDGPGVYVHKANETYLGILRIYSATTTSDGPWTYVLRGCMCLASLEYLLGPVLLAFAYAGFFKNCTLGYRVAALPFTSTRDLMYGMCQNTNGTFVDSVNRKLKKTQYIFAYIDCVFFPSLSCYYYCYHCDGFVYPAGQSQKNVLYIAYLYDQTYPN